MANDFLPFAGAGGANVISQAAYAALGARTSGFAAGVASSAQLNKAWRQSSLIAAAVGQTIDDITGLSALDDGTTANLVIALKRAMTMSGGTIVSSTRNLRMSLTTAGSVASFTADEVVVKTGLGGSMFLIPSFNKTLNIASVGVNGMDIGASPANTWVAVYAIYNPTTGVSGLLGVNVASALAPNTYGGANMPAGFTASALLSVWLTNLSALLVPGYQIERVITVAPTNVLSTATISASYTALSIPAAVPRNAVSCFGGCSFGCSGGSGGSAMKVAADANGLGSIVSGGYISSAPSIGSQGMFTLALTTPQTIYHLETISGAPTGYSIVIYVSGYTI